MKKAKKHSFKSGEHQALGVIFFLCVCGHRHLRNCYKTQDVKNVVYVVLYSLKNLLAK